MFKIPRLFPDWKILAIFPFKWHVRFVLFPYVFKTFIFEVYMKHSNDKNFVIKSTQDSSLSEMVTDNTVEHQSYCWTGDGPHQGWVSSLEES